MVNKKKLISLCIPTNGVTEWFSQVIDSIYNQNVSMDCFEVIVVDNGNNKFFYKYICEKKEEYPNIRYKKIKCSLFMNEIEAYRMAEGVFIKFVNHRTVLLDGTLERWIKFVQDNLTTKPIVYFSNGELNKEYDVYQYDSFGEFIENLSYYSSWSTGMAIWKEDLKDLDVDNINALFPHTELLFKNRKDRNYLIDNQIYLREVPHTSKRKGKYDLFYAFAVEYPALLLELYRNGDIGIDTFLKVKQENLDFIIENHRLFCEKKMECSYDLSSYDKSINVFYSHDMVKKRIEDNKELFRKELEKRISNIGTIANAIVVYGAGIMGKKYIMENGSENVICFIDKNEFKQGKVELGIPIISYEEFLEKEITAKIIVCVKREHFVDEEKTLSELRKEYIFWEKM